MDQQQAKRAYEQASESLSARLSDWLCGSAYKRASKQSSQLTRDSGDLKVFRVSPQGEKGQQQAGAAASALPASAHPHTHPASCTCILHHLLPCLSNDCCAMLLCNNGTARKLNCVQPVTCTFLPW